MSEATGILDVITPSGTETYSWNGNPADRKKAEEAFNEAMRSGSFLAVVYDSPSKAHQVSSFKEITDYEKEHGLVSAQISPALVGG